jgi:hypothetical protein
MSDSTNTVLFDGTFFQAVDIGKEGGRFAVVRKGGVGTVLMTAINPRSDEREIVIEAAQALDAAAVARNEAALREEARKRGFFGRWIGR